MNKNTSSTHNKDTAYKAINYKIQCKHSQHNFKKMWYTIQVTDWIQPIINLSWYFKHSIIFALLGDSCQKTAENGSEACLYQKLHSTKKRWSLVDASISNMVLGEINTPGLSTLSSQPPRTFRPFQGQLMYPFSSSRELLGRSPKT